MPSNESGKDRSDALVGQHYRREETAAFDGQAGFIHFGPDAQELDGVVSGDNAFIHTQLTGLAKRIGKTGLSIHDGQTHAGDTLLVEFQRADRTCGTDLAAVIAARIAARPVGDQVRRPEPLAPLYKPQRLKQRIVGTRTKTLAAADAECEELRFGHAPGGRTGWKLAGSVSCAANGPGDRRYGNSARNPCCHTDRVCKELAARHRSDRRYFTVISWENHSSNRHSTTSRCSSGPSSSSAGT